MVIGSSSTVEVVELGAGKASEPAGRPSEPAGLASELAGGLRSQLGGLAWESQLGGPRIS